MKTREPHADSPVIADDATFCGLVFRPPNEQVKREEVAMELGRGKALSFMLVVKII